MKFILHVGKQYLLHVGSRVSDWPRGGGEGKYEVRQRTVTTGRRLRWYARSRIWREHTKVVGGGGRVA
jgi:hypothetical protein